MTIGTRRAWARVGAGMAALLLAGAVGGTGGWAQAPSGAGADLSVSAVSAPLPRDAGRSMPFSVSLANAGPHTARDVVLLLDFTKLDTALVGYTAPRGCARSGQRYRCGFGALASQGTTEFSIGLRAKGGTGPAGSVAVSISSSTTDPDRANNAIQVPVDVAERGFDLVAVAFDVYADGVAEEVEPQPVRPGHGASLHWFAVNPRPAGRNSAGSAQGVGYTVALPAHVTFAEHRDGCAYSPDNRVMTCQDAGAVLAAGGSNGYVPEPVRVVVDKLAGAPVLVGGSVSAYALRRLATVPADPASGGAGTAVKPLSEAQQDQLASAETVDSVARFQVHVAEQDATAGSAGWLPITGAQAGLIGGVGLAVLAAGGVLFVVARRRRLVLVVPDERSPGL